MLLSTSDGTSQRLPPTEDPLLLQNALRSLTLREMRFPRTRCITRSAVASHLFYFLRRINVKVDTRCHQISHTASRSLEPPAPIHWKDKWYLALLRVTKTLNFHHNTSYNGMNKVLGLILSPPVDRVCVTDLFWYREFSGG